MPKSLSSRCLNIVARYKELKNLRHVGAEFNISYERVRQYLVMYEKETSELIPRKPGYDAIIHPDWKCPSCGLNFSYNHQKQNQKCWSCHLKNQPNTKPDQVYENWINQLNMGKTLYRLTIEENIYGPEILVGILAYLKRKNNLDRAIKLFSTRSVHWLKPKINWPEFFDKA